MKGFGKRRRFISWMITFMMAATLIYVPAASVYASDANKLTGPRCLVDVNAGESDAGFMTTWDCVWFGSYPQNEVTSEDGEIYTRLKALDDSQWVNYKTEIDGVKYTRLFGSASYYFESSPVEGMYPYNGDFGKWHYFRYEPVKWRVLEIDGTEAVLMADKILDAYQWHNETSDYAKWENCLLRSWLNGYDASANLSGADYTKSNFLDDAFSAEEQKAIKLTNVTMEDSIFGTDPATGAGVAGNDTQDYVYLLQESDVLGPDGNAFKYGFSSVGTFWEKDDENKYAQPTTYANAWGAIKHTAEGKRKGNGNWWLRSPAEGLKDAPVIDQWGMGVYQPDMDSAQGVRPVITIDLTSELYKYAGTAKWDGTGEEIEYDDGKIDVGELSEPVVTDSNVTVSGKNVIWTRIEYGSYPQTEITAEDPVYSKLTAKSKDAAWMAYGNKLTVDGEKYYRLEYYYTNYAKYEDDMRVKDDGWKDGTVKYRYFRYDPIEWRVLEVDGTKVLLLADKGLDAQMFNDGAKDTANVTWATSTLRSWLNGYNESQNSLEMNYTKNNFINKAFSEEEIAAIDDTSLTHANNLNFGNMSDGGKGGKATTDKIFLLSESDVYKTQTAEKYGFRASELVQDESRQCRGSDYTYAMGASYSDYACHRGSTFWWLRSPGRYQYYGMFVLPSGTIDINGEYAAFPSVGATQAVRPAIVLDLSKTDLAKETGTIESKDSHSHWLEHVKAKEATCTEDGNIEHALCKDCKARFKKFTNIVLSDDEVIIPATGHSYKPGYDENEHWTECSCGDKKDIVKHEFGEWTQTKEPAETEPGEKVRQCTGCEYKEVKEIPALSQLNAWGNANGDGKVNVKDAVLVLQYVNKKIDADKINIDVCDVNGDGKVNVKDAVMILQYANKKIEHFPVEE